MAVVRGRFSLTHTLQPIVLFETAIPYLEAAARWTRAAKIGERSGRRASRFWA